MAFFKLKLGGKTMVLPEGEHDVGRMGECWLSLDDELASRCHARFHVHGASAELEDLGSRNGTFVNGERVVGRRVLRDGDRIRIGRELIAVLASDAAEGDDALRRTLGGEGEHLPSFMVQLVERSLKAGRIKDAERFTTALLGQLQASQGFGASHPAVLAGLQSLVRMAEHSRSGVWIDRLFKLVATHGWILDDDVLERVRAALDRIPRVSGRGIREYEDRLRALEREGTVLPPHLAATIAELADAYAGD